MTPDQRAVLAVQEAGGYTDEVPVIAEAIRAALRERDAAALTFEAVAAWANKNDRAVVALGYLHDLTKRAVAAETERDRLRALLEEAGKK